MVEFTLQYLLAHFKADHCAVFVNELSFSEVFPYCHAHYILLEGACITLK